MSDLLLLGLGAGLFAIAGAYVSWCERIIGPDSFPLILAPDVDGVTNLDPSESSTATADDFTSGPVR